MRSEVLHEDGVDFFVEYFFDVLDGFPFVPLELLDKVADAVVSVLQKIVQQTVLLSFELFMFASQLGFSQLVVALHVRHVLDR